jgi:hypothetical protein
MRRAKAPQSPFRRQSRAHALATRIIAFEDRKRPADTTEPVAQGAPA